MNAHLLKPCDILLYRGTSFTSKLIQWGTKSEYSHVAVVVDPAIHLAIESNTGHQSGVRALDLRAVNPMIVSAFRVKLSFSFESKKIISFLVGHLGAKFDYLGVSWLGALKVASLIPGVKRKFANRFQKQKDYFCSELCYEAFMAGGLDIVPAVEQADITSPADIANSERLERLSINAPLQASP